MLEEFVDEENDQWGLDNWFNKSALLYSSGIPAVSTVDGQLVCNLNDATLEKAMNYQYDLYTAGLVLPLEQFNWAIQPQMMGEGRQLFYIGGYWEAEGDPSVWTHGVAPENLGFVPTPSPAGSDPYQHTSRSSTSPICLSPHPIWAVLSVPHRMQSTSKHLSSSHTRSVLRPMLSAL